MFRSLFYPPRGRSFTTPPVRSSPNLDRGYRRLVRACVILSLACTHPLRTVPHAAGRGSSCRNFLPSLLCSLCSQVIHVGELFGDPVSMTPGQTPWGRTTSQECQEELASKFHYILKVGKLNTRHNPWDTIAHSITGPPYRPGDTLNFDVMCLCLEVKSGPLSLPPHHLILDTQI